MAINPLSGLGPGSISGAGSTPKVSGGESFKSELQKATTSAANGPAKPAATAIEAKSVSKVDGGCARVDSQQAVGGTKSVTASGVINQVQEAQARMDDILKLAESGKAFSPAELLSLQTHVYRASQELDLAGKVVEKATGGIKQVLQTQV